MIKRLVSLIHDRRKRDEECDACCTDRRKPTLVEAAERVSGALENFTQTVTLSPDKVKELIRKAGL